MTTFTRSNVKFKWMDAFDQSYQELKKRLVIVPILTILEGEHGFVIYCHVSGRVLGAYNMEE